MCVHVCTDYSTNSVSVLKYAYELITQQLFVFENETLKKMDADFITKNVSLYILNVLKY